MQDSERRMLTFFLKKKEKRKKKKRMLNEGDSDVSKGTTITEGPNNPTYYNGFWPTKGLLQYNR